MIFPPLFTQRETQHPSFTRAHITVFSWGSWKYKCAERLRRNRPMRTPGRCAQEWNFLGDPFAQLSGNNKVRKMGLVISDFPKEREIGCHVMVPSLHSSALYDAVRNTLTPWEPLCIINDHCLSQLGLLPGCFLPQRNVQEHCPSDHSVQKKSCKGLCRSHFPHPS